MKAVILAGGLGERLRPLTKIIPKPLLPVGEQSVLEITLLAMKNYGVKEILIALNYQSELFRAFLGDGSRWELTISCSQEQAPLGTAGPLRLFADRLTEPFIVMNGDILTSLDFRDIMKNHIDSGAILTVATKGITLPLRYGIIDTEQGRICSVREKPNLYAEVVAGIYVCNPSVISVIPEGATYSMIDVIKYLLDNQMLINHYPLHDYWLDIGQMEDYERAQELYAQGIFSRENEIS
ncbi:MAG: NTP transferase domain-containing protein [Armatimonadetes bacterium]|nr:NTP transferase domain-containing protein [Armatimonadota bacterium]